MNDFPPICIKEEEDDTFNNTQYDQIKMRDHKVNALQNMLKKSKNCVLITSYDIPEKCGLFMQRPEEDECDKLDNVKEEKDPQNADPSSTHFCIVKLMEAQKIKVWVTTTPDPLPFKAGCKKGAILQLNGSLNDKDNPYVKGSSKVHHWQYKWMQDLCDSADMVITFGSRFKDINVARLAQTVALKALENDKQILEGNKPEEESLGLIIINGKPTRYDEICQVRIWSPPELVLEKICKNLRLPVNKKVFNIGRAKWRSYVHKV